MIKTPSLANYVKVLTRRRAQCSGNL